MVKVNPPAELVRNFRLNYAVCFFTNAAFILPIYILFGQEQLNLSYLQAGSFFIVSTIVGVLVDFIGGAVADRFGRKKSFALGVVLKIVATTAFVLTGSYAVLLGMAVVMGVGNALMSNSLDADLYEQAKHANAEAYFRHANAMQQAYTFAGRIVASVLGGLAYVVQPGLPYLLEAAALAVALACGLAMRFNRVTDNSEVSEQSMGRIMRSALRVYAGNRALLSFTIFSFLGVLWMDVLFGYYQPYFIELGSSPQTLGVMFSVISVASAGGALLMRVLPARISPQSINGLIIFGSTVTGLLLLVLNIPLAYAAPLVLGLVSGFSWPNARLYVNQQVSNVVRTSVMSVTSTSISLGYVLGLMIALWAAQSLAAQTTLWIVIVGSVATLIANGIIRSKGRQEQAMA